MQHRHATILIILIILLFPIASAAAQDECVDEACSVAVSALPESEMQIVHGLSAEEIMAYESPEFDTLVVNDELLYDRSYQRVEGTVNIYDAPGGSVVRTLDAGFNFITSLGAGDGWTQINSAEWMSSDVLTASNDIVSHFTGIFLPDPLQEYTVAWMLINAYPASEPGGESLEDNGLMYRYTLLNIFAEVEIDGWIWYQIGVDKWVHQTWVARILPVERPEDVETERWISIDLYEQILIVYEEGDKPIFATLIASGLPRWPTYEGTFNVYFRRTRKDMSWGTPGDDFYLLEEVPWTMFFDEGRAMHGAYWHDGFGYRRSHGCVNMSITDAHWLYLWVASEFGKLNSPETEEGPGVYVYSSGQYR